MTTLPRPAMLEDWYRERYFTASIDISGSGVENYRLGEVFAMAGADLASLAGLRFADSHSLGGADLRVAIANAFGTGDPVRVLVANGSTEVLYLVLRALLRPGDDVVVTDPAYHSLSELAESLAGRVRRWPLRYQAGLVTNVDDLVAAVRPGTRAVVVNFPHNPTGATLTPAARLDLVDACERVGAYLLWDAATAALTYDAPPLPDPAGPRTVTFGTLSKAYGLPGLRVGWAVAEPALLAACARLRDYTTLALSPLVEAVALLAVRHNGRLLAPRLAQAARNRNLTTAWAAEHADLIDWAAPGGGVCAFPRLPGIADVEAFADDLERDHGVLVVPGTCWGRHDRVRLGFGGPTDDLRSGLRRLARSLAEARSGARRH
jgi:capreomycidine synthase